MDALGRSYHTPKDPTGVINATPLRLDVLQFIHRFPYVPTHYIDHWFGANQWQIRTELFAKGYVNKSIKAYNTSEATGTLALMPKNSWSLTKKGEALLRSKRPTEPFIPLGRFSDHQLYSTLIGTSLLFGARELALTFGFTDDILQHPNCPPITDEHPFSFKVDKTTLTADARPFKLSAGKRSMFFWGFEADRKTESLNSEAQNSIINKFRRYEAMLDAAYHQKFGLPNINILFVTITDDHRERMIDLLRTAIDPRWYKNFWFTTYADAAPHLDFPEPTGRVLTGDWYTTNGQTSLVSFLKGGA